MKKLSSIIAAFCAATAFCGFCTACSKTSIDEGTNNNNPNPPAVTPNDTDNTATDNQDDGILGDTPAVILVPGRSMKESKVEGDGIAALTDEQKATYFIENGYMCTLAVDTDLPVPTTTNANVKFIGWRYADGSGLTVTVTKMPDAKKDIVLYAEWAEKGTSTGGNQSGDTGNPGEVIPADSAKIVVGTKNFILKLTNYSDKGKLNIHVWPTGGTGTTWPGVEITLGATVNVPGVTIGASDKVNFIINWTGGQTVDLNTTGNGETVTVDLNAKKK